MIFGKRWQGLRTRIIVWSFVPTAVILAAVALVTFLAYQQVTEDLVVERDQEVTRLAAGQLSGEMDGYTDLLEEVARNNYIRTPYPVSQRVALQNFSNRLAVFDGGVVLLNNWGRVVGATPEREEIRGQDWSDREYFRTLIRTQKPVFSNILTDGPQGAEVVAVVVAVHGNQGELQGALVGMFRVAQTSVSSFYGGIVKQRFSNGGSTYIVDRYGRVIFHSDRQRIGEDFSSQAVVRELRAGRVGAVRTRNLEGEVIVAGYSPIPGTPWGLVTEESWAQLTQGSEGYRRFLILLLGAGMLLPVGLLVYGVRRIMEPIRSLTLAAQEISRGNFIQRTYAPTGDEIEELSHQFNNMAEQLRESYAQLEQRVADRTRELAALHAIAVEASRSLDLPVVLEGALDKTLEVTGLTAGGFYLWSEEMQMLKLVAYRGFSQTLPEAIGWLHRGEGIPGWVLENGEPLVVNDLSTDPRVSRDAIRREGFHSAASFPLIARDVVIGVLFVTTHGFREFEKQDVDLLTSVSRQIGVAVENARLFAKSERRMKELDSLYRADEELLRHLELDQVLQALVDVSVDILDADKCSILVLDEERNQLTIQAARSFSPDTVGNVRFSLQDGAVAKVIHTGEPVIVEDVDRYPELQNEMVQKEGIRSFMNFPIRANGKVFGIFNINYLVPRGYTREDQRLFNALTQRAALAVENAQLYGQAQYLATLEERQRLARELHDAVTQTLFSASLVAEVLPILWERKPEEGQRRLQELRELTRGALAEMRSLLLELRPSALEDASSEELFRHLKDAFIGRTRIPLELQMDDDVELAPKAKLVFYRVAQEALNNIAKHADAHQVILKVDAMPEGVYMVLQDDGRGFDVESISAGHFGLAIMQERAEEIGATLVIESHPGAGTRVHLQWKCSSPVPSELVD